MVYHVQVQNSYVQSGSVRLVTDDLAVLGLVDFDPTGSFFPADEHVCGIIAPPPGIVHMS